MLEPLLAEYRQSGGGGADRFPNPRGGHSPSSSNGGAGDHVSIGIRSTRLHHSKPSRPRRSGRSDKFRRRVSVCGVVLILALVLLLTVLAYYYLSRDTKEIDSYPAENDDFLRNVTRTQRNEVKFGQGSGGHGRDSRYWDRDYRRRDEDYNENVVENSSMDSNDETHKGDDLMRTKNSNKKSSIDDSVKGSDRRGIGLYNEAGRNELKIYEAQYEASLENVGKLSTENENNNQLFDPEDLGKQDDVAEAFDEYDDGFDFHDAQTDDDTGHGKGDYLDVVNSHNEGSGDSRESSDVLSAGRKHQNVAEDLDETFTNPHEDSSLNSQNIDKSKTNSRHVNFVEKQSTRTRSGSKKKPKRRKFSGIEHVGGDMFHNVPKGDAIMIKYVLHDWSDEDCMKLLRNCYEALPNNGKVVIIELLMQEAPDSSMSSQYVSRLDNGMLFSHEGKERTEKEFEALCKGSGFSKFKVVCCAYAVWAVMEFHK